MIDNIIVTDSSKCRQCYSCVRNCPVKAVKIKEGKAQIIQSRCIQCGSCVKHCSRGAKIIKKGISSTQALLQSGKKVIALLAPSFAVSFFPLTIQQIIYHMQCLGFYEVWETAIGAEYIINYISEYLQKTQDRPLLSSACPAFVSLIEKHYPNLIDYLAPVCSPMVAAARVIKKKYFDQDIAIVFIGPCIAKKDEMVQIYPEHCIDEVLTFQEMKQLLKQNINASDKIISTSDTTIKYYTASVRGRSIPLSAGIISNISNNYPQHGLLSCDDIQNCMELVNYINQHVSEEQDEDVKIYDTLMCRGCIDGSCIDNEASLFEKRRILLDFLQNKEVLPFQVQYKDFLDIDLSRQYHDRKITIQEPSEEHIKKILADINKLKAEDELNCGACGYASCREKAIAVYQGIAEVEMCIPYLLTKKNELLDQLTKKFKTINELNEQMNGIFESSYDGFIVCDSEGNIIKVNSAWKKMLNIADKQIPKNVKELEKRGIIYPSATLLAVKEKRRITFLQESKNGKKFIATGNPIIDLNGTITGVVTNMRDIEELNRLRTNFYSYKTRNARSFEGIIANSVEFGKVLETATQAAQFQSTILILGETGVGKDVVAKFIHQLSGVKDGPFIKVNCGAIPENLIESELFGYDSGAFTGAKREGKKGFFELADEGTIFLDEIGDLPLSMQVKLLQVIQDKKVNRIGASKSRPIDVRIITATNRDLQQMIKEGSFRSDLFYRLNVIPIYIPPLRERADDIIPLAYHFLDVFNQQYQCRKEFSPDIPSTLTKCYWPGNVRELQNIIERVVVTSKQTVISCNDLPTYIYKREGVEEKAIVVNNIIPLKEAIDEVEKQIISRAYKAYNNTYKIAEILGVNQSTVVRKLKKMKK